MNIETVDIVDNLIQAVSLLDKTDEYLESLNDRLSKCDSLKSDYEHLLENIDVTELNLQKYISDFQECLRQRRKIKKDFQVGQHLKSNIGKINSKDNRDLLLSGIKSYVKTQSKHYYTNNILTDDDIKILTHKEEKRKRGRPRKVKEGV